MKVCKLRIYDAALKDIQNAIRFGSTFYFGEKVGKLCPFLGSEIHRTIFSQKLFSFSTV